MKQTMKNLVVTLPGAGYRQYNEFRLVGIPYYWTSTLYSDVPQYAYHLEYRDGTIHLAYNRTRFMGLTIRAVQ